MKDLEKIKSEDLGCQVADANPGNFGIEQEVAQLVGATVPAPTEPSADDARELGAQLLVFLRRALTPIQSALRTALAAIYAHLDSRCTDYTPAAYDPFRLPAGPYDPMRPFAPRTLPNLLTAITAFSSRKIYEPNAIDGISLIQQVAGTAAASMTSLEDNTHGWTFRSTALFSIFSAVEVWTLNCKDYIPNPSYGYNHGQGFFKGNNTVRKLNIPEFEGWQAEGTALYCYIAANCANIEEIHAPSMWRFNGENSATNTNNISQDPKLWWVEMGDMKDHLGWSVYYFYQCPKLIRLEFKGVQGSINLSNWNPSYVLSDNPTGTDLIEEGSTAANNLEQFLQNFRDHIALRLTDQGSGKTLTLSQAVRDAIHAAEATYGIEAIIVTQKGWTLSPAPGASSQ